MMASGPRGFVNIEAAIVEKAQCAISLRPVEKLDQGQESEGTGGDARY
jgi:hypothetical protein